MSNWFENNQTKSVIIYTVTILAAAYASTYFILDENKERRHSAEKENLNTQIQTLHERINLLEYENQNLRSENRKQTEWLQSIPGTSIYFEKKITDLQALLKNKDTSRINIGVETNAKYNIESQLIDIGSAFVDPFTGTSIGINEISIERMASGIINLPNQPESKFSQTLVGKRWTFIFRNRKFEIIILELNWAGSKYRIRIMEN